MNIRKNELYIGANYHPHDWPADRWPVDLSMMREAGFNVVRLGHLCWDSFEPADGEYDFSWFDTVMDLCAENGLGVFLDVSMRPAPVWVHRLCPGCNIGARSGRPDAALRRYMEDVADPDYQRYALRFARVLVNRYKDHPALLAFGLCNELGAGYPSYSEASLERFKVWLEKKYGTVEALNRAWAARRWSRRLQSFEDVSFPENEVELGSPEARLDTRRFFSDGIADFMIKLKKTVEECAPGVPHSSNHYSGKNDLGFDLLRYSDDFVDYPGIGHYPGHMMNDKAHYCYMILSERLYEQPNPLWCLEFQAGWFGIAAGPKGWLYSQAMLCLLYRTQMILGWTWRSMLNGEEEFITGLLGHDGYPTPNFDEYRHMAEDFRKLESTGLFPYLPEPKIAIAFSQESQWETQVQPSHFHQPYTESVVQAHRALFDLDLDYNMVNLRDLKKNYEILIVPAHVIMEKKAADTIRAFAENGGTVIMTGYTAVTDETGRAFDVPCPGGLSDVFGIRVAGYLRAGQPGFDGEPVPAERRISFEDGEVVTDLEYSEVLELHGAETIASFENGSPAVTVAPCGKGQAYYLAAESNHTFIEHLLRELTGAVPLPGDVHAREIAPGVRFYVNTGSKSVDIPLEAPGSGLLAGRNYTDVMTLPPYGAELMRFS